MSRNTDYAEWAQTQANLLRAGKFDALDTQEIIKELDNIMGNERREIKNRMMVLLAHLLKWQFQPEFQGKSWRATINIQRRDIEDVVTYSPSLRPILAEAVETAYPKARKQAAIETGLPEADFPRVCPYSLDDIMDADYWPD